MDHVNVAKNVRGKDQQKRTTTPWSEQRRDSDERKQHENREKEREEIEEVEKRYAEVHTVFRPPLVLHAPSLCFRAVFSHHNLFFAPTKVLSFSFSYKAFQDSVQRFPVCPVCYIQYPIAHVWCWLLGRFGEVFNSSRISVPR